MNTSVATSTPSWLETPPRSRVEPPIRTRLQELPFGELTWEDFERLCLRLARLEANVEHCQLYGVRGQEQEGIDLYARHKFSEKYTVFQCKRVNDFGPAKIQEAVSKFLEGTWVSKTETFVLCTKEGLRTKERADEFEAQSALLKEEGIALLPWDSHELSVKLKDLPKLVDDFFGRQWVVEFCGQEEADRLGKRLDASQVTEFRKKCGLFYEHVFGTHDPGLPIATLGAITVLPLHERFVLPDVYDRRIVAVPYPTEVNEPESPRSGLNSSRLETTDIKSSQRTTRPHRTSVLYQLRKTVDDWLATAEHSIILGGPGSGKSTLLRFIAIDLLRESPTLALLSQKWGQFLPVWVPFALWTKTISCRANASCSLSELLHEWLRSWDEERLWPLVEQALEDERLLLLVDGLDEWTNESAARIALDRLRVFIEQRNVPAIITSRPHGFDRLGMQEANWQLGELCDFSTVQQKKLSQMWFMYKLRSLEQDSNYQESEIEQKASTESEGFLTELHSLTDLRELAKIPLLLCLLIYHRFQNAHLPQSRFKAYDSLIEHLISTHPQRRRAAALLTDIESELTVEDTKKIFACLAFHIQEHFGEGLISQNEAISIVEDYLEDLDHGFGLEQHEARRYSRMVMSAGEDTIGLLVKWSPTEIGFFHRVFKEHLAAYYLSLMPFSEQLSAVQTHCADPQWREVILGLFHLTSRGEDINNFTNSVEAKLETLGAVDRHSGQLLLSETAFGDFNCPVGLARELAQKAFEQIELETWMPQRERLLRHVLDGLRSTKVRELVKSKLQSWFPCRVRWRSGIFSAMSKWPRVPEVVECLIKGLSDEETDNQRAAARALADLATGDLDIGNRIASLAYNAVDPRVRAVAIEGLLRGWSDHADMERVLGAARESASPELRLAAIIGKIKLHTQTTEDWKELIRLGLEETPLDYYWRGDVAAALMDGWPQSPKTKDVCFKAIRERARARQQYDRTLALRILLNSYPQDEDVAQFCIHEIKHERYPFLMLHFDAWHLLQRNFRDHPQVVQAIDEWLPKQEHNEPEIAMAALVGRTPIAKAKLLSSLGGSFPHWPASALLEEWGMKDAEVADKLRQFAFGSIAEASRIGHLLPRIIEDKTTCRRRLLDLLQAPECTRPDFVVHGLGILGNTQGDAEIVDVILSLLLDRKNYFHQDIIAGLVTNYSSDPRVQDLAKKDLSEREGNYAAVAWAYGNDEEIRNSIIEIACPLPVRLRSIIASCLGEVGLDETSAMSLLRLYDHESDEEVKTLASISYHTRLRASQQDTSQAIETLSHDIVCYGFDHEERRRAAFCGLVILGRLDVMANARETIGDDRPCSISLAKMLSPNVPLVRHVLQNWDDIKAAFGDETWSRLSKNYSDSSLIWGELCMFADEYPAPRDEALRFLETRVERTTQPNILRFLGRVRPKSRLLLEYCLKTLRIGEDQYDCSANDEVIEAAELLGTHFGSDQEVLKRIVSGNAARHIYEKVILALCEGWPDSEELGRIYEVVRKQKLPLSYATYFSLMSRKGSSKTMLGALMKLVSNSGRIHQRYLLGINRPVISRLRTDDNLYAMLTEALQNELSPSSKATIPRLIGAGRGITPELRAWCTGEVDRQLRGQQSPEIGFDLLAGELRPVVHSLLDVLSQIR